MTPVRSGVPPRVARAPAGRPFLPGPGFRAAVASNDGRGTVTGPGRAGCSRPIPDSPASGSASTRPATGFDRSRTTASSPAGASALPRCGRADGRRFRRGRLRGPGRAARRSGTRPRPDFPPGCRGYRGSPCSPRYAPGPGVPRDRLRCRPGVRSTSVATGCAAAGVPHGAGVPREAFPLRLVTDGTGSRGSGPARVRRCSPAASLDVAVCEAVHHRIPPGRAVSAPPVASDDGRRRRPAVTGWVYGGDRALTSRFTPALVCAGSRRCRAAPDSVRREGAARAPRRRRQSVTNYSMPSLVSVGP